MLNKKNQTVNKTLFLQFRHNLKKNENEMNVDFIVNSFYGNVL